MRIFFFFSLFCAFLLIACNSDSNNSEGPANRDVNQPIDVSPKPDSGNANTNVKLPHVNQGPYVGPPVQVDILQMESHPVQYAVSVSLTTNTGGWTFELDEGHVIDGVAKVFFTLERPAEDEMVTQALVKHQKSFTTTKPIQKAEVYIHLAQRGVQTLTTDYRLATPTSR